MEENWRRWKKNPFLKKMEEKKEYEGGKIKEWKEDDDEEDRQRIEEDRKYLEGLKDENQDMGDLRDLYNEL